MAGLAAPQVCSVCVLNDVVFQLTFDKSGQCSACKNAMERRKYEWFPNEIGRDRLAELVLRLRRAGEGKPYDAMIGLSGGIDSAYLAHLVVKEFGLRVLAVHVDAGWNSSSAVQNIERIVRRLNIDLFTHVVEWKEMADLQLAFIKASVFNQDIPQDHAFFSTLYRTSAQFGIQYFLSGVNYATESVSPKHSTPNYLDSKHIRAIHGKFGSVPLRQFELMSFFEYLFVTKLRGRPTVAKPLDFINYDKEQARRLLQDEYGWADYGDKHCESRFTKFYQEIYLPRKYGFDKRCLHLSSLIVSGQRTRAEALAVLATPIISEEDAKRQIRFVAKKLGVTAIKLETLLQLPTVDHMAYPNGKRTIDRLFKLRRLITGQTSPEGVG